MTNERKEELAKMMAFARAAKEAVEQKQYSTFPCPSCGATAWAYRDAKEKVRACCDKCGSVLIG